MLIEYLFEKFSNWEDVGNQAIGDLHVSQKNQFFTLKKKKENLFPFFLKEKLVHVCWSYWKHMIYRKPLGGRNY
jgi:hypothetical protein